MTSWTYRKNGLIRKIRLISKFMTSRPGYQRTTTHILLIISRISQTKKCEKWDRETSSRPLFVFKKSFILGKSKWSAAWFHCISIALKLAYNRNKLFRTLHYWFRNILNFDFLDKGPGIVSPAHFVYDFSTKMFLMLCCINWPNFIVWLPLLREILGNICIAIAC